jgi:hypothetical protein
MTEETFQAILCEMRAGTALRQALAHHGVNKFSFFNAIDKSAFSADQYARARAASLDSIAEEALGIADDDSIPSDHKRVMVDTRKWLLSKLAPKKYGDHVDLTISANRSADALSDGELVALALGKALPALIDGQRTSE